VDELKVMIDSGAFSVWQSGAAIDIVAYAEYCRGSKAHCFVNLDVIPEGPDQKSSDRAPRKGWMNYTLMSRELPGKTVIPVYHYGEDRKWLDKYKGDGCDYIGLGGLASVSGPKRRAWLDSLRKDLQKVRVHGFAVASHDILSAFPWHSVDSTTWAMHAQVWHVLVPKRRGGGWDYTQTPMAVKLSPRGRKGDDHIDRLSPLVRKAVNDYLAENGMVLGRYEVRACQKGHKRRPGEYWLDAKKTSLVHTVEPGLATDVGQRQRLNARLYRKSAEAIGIPEFYFSGVGTCPEWVGELGHVLLSFNGIPKGYDKWL